MVARVPCLPSRPVFASSAMFIPDFLSEFPQPQRRRDWLRRAAASALLLGVGIPASKAVETTKPFEWKVVTEDGRDYVRLEEIKKFYSFPKLQRDGRNSWLRSSTMIIKFSSGAEDIYINNVKFCLSFPIIEKGGSLLASRVDLAKLLDPIIRPTHITSTSKGFDTVVIDAGHGGHDSGAVGPYGAEKVYTLDTVFRLEKKLKTLGYQTVLTRRTDEFIALGDRAAVANRTPNCIFVSVHFNSFGSGGSSAIGLETFALAPQGAPTTYDQLKTTDMNNRRGNVRDSENIALATAVHSNTLFRLRSVDRGVKRARYSVISGIEKPGILVEGGFVSNQSEGARIHRPEFRETLAESICGGIGNYRKAVMKFAPRTGS
jgi:N-acetylmuramoyl-L-alanine amidase